MDHIRYIVLMLALSFAMPLWGQVDKKDVRRGNKDFRKGEYEMAFQDYLRAYEKDTTSIAANYNMAGALYRMEQYDQAQQALDRINETAPATASAADYFFNLGDVALQKKDYQAAVKAFGESLILRPDDLQAKENFIYAKLMLQNQQNQQNGEGQNDDQQDNQDQNQDQNQNNDQNENDQDQNNDQNQDKQDEQNKDQDNQDDQNQNDDQNNDNKDNKPQPQESQPQEQESKISPQAAQQMLQAIQAKEKETQDKVNQKKAQALKSRMKDKNW